MLCCSVNIFNVFEGRVINYGEVGWGIGYKIGKSRVRNFLRPPPPSGQGKTFRAPPPFKKWKLFAPPFNIAKTSSYRLKKLPQNLLCPPSPLSMAKTFSATPPPLSGGLKLQAPPPPCFVTPLPVISDQSLKNTVVWYLW